MDACEIIELQASRENWKAVSIVLMSAIVIVLISSVAYKLGKVSVEEEVRHSGYTITEIHTTTNNYYTIEKVR